MYQYLTETVSSISTDYLNYKSRNDWELVQCLIVKDKYLVIWKRRI